MAKKIKIKADNYYLDYERNLCYVIGLKKYENPNCIGYMDEQTGERKHRGWEFKCLSSGKSFHLDEESLELIFVTDLGSTIAPAMRLLYSGI